MLNVALLKKVKAHILEEPRRFIMGSWRENGAPGETLYLNGDIARRIPQCGTAACICGWATLLSSNEQVGREQFFNRGPELLGIPMAVDFVLPDTTKELFFVESWPASFKSQWASTRSLRKRAEIAGRRIDAYIRKYGPKKTRKKAA